jgi:Pyridoxamine 5'-phosphate oxidase
VTASLPAEIQSVFDRFITTELTTIDRRGQPITWPVTPYYRPGDACIDVTTGLGYPEKAHDARANPMVTLLFSDPRGSGLEQPPMVLVQGSADVEDRDYTRIYIHVRPERIYVWPHGEVSRDPELFGSHMEEVRSGHSEEPRRFHASPTGGVSSWHPRIRELGTRYPTAVLSFVSPDGFPFSVRVPVGVDPAARWIRLGAEPAGVPLAPGLACLTVHEHGEHFSFQPNFQVRGDLTPVPDGWALVPRQIIGEFKLPSSRLAMIRANATKFRRVWATARRELRGPK